LCNPELEEQASLKIIDFGLSAKTAIFETVDDNCGTLIYMPPEQAISKEYSKVSKR